VYAGDASAAQIEWTVQQFLYERVAALEAVMYTRFSSVSK